MAEPLRVFQLIKGLGRGGAEMLLPESLRHADRERFVYAYGYFLPHKDALVDTLTSQGADVVCFRAATNSAILLSARRVARHLKAWGADLVHCHLPLAGVVGRIAGRMARVPVVYTEHNLMERYHPVTRWLNLLTWGWQHRVLAVSSEVAHSIRAHSDSRVPMEVAVNGVDTARFRRRGTDMDAVRRQFGIARDAPVIGTVAVFREQKRLDDWLHAARLIHDRDPSARFLLVGDGPLRDELVALTRSLRITDAVQFAGLQADVRPYMAAMDVYMMSSEFEGLPVALLEAMAMECAVVSTAVGGVPEVLEHGVTGMLTQPRAPASLAALAVQVLQTPGRRAALGAAARAKVERQFSMRRMVAQLENSYVRTFASASARG